MATFKAKVFKHHLKDDGTFNVKICVYHNGKQAYPDTEYFVTKKQLNSKFEIKDVFLNERINDLIKSFRLKLIDLGDRSQLYTAKELGEYLLPGVKSMQEKQIDFFAFSREYIENHRTHHKKINTGKEKRDHYADGFQTTINALADFFNTDKILITELTSKALINFETYLKSERKAKRVGPTGSIQEIKLKPVGSTTIFNYMTNIRTLFNAAKERYNDLDKGEIMINHYPFSKYKIPEAVATKSRSLERGVVQLIRDYPDTHYSGTHGTNRANMSRDVFMLSFYLIGMNSIDLFYINNYKNGRLTYNRSKTSGRRQNQALISINVEPEAEALIERYRDKTGERVFCFYQMYSDSDGFSKAVNKGLKRITENSKIADHVTLYNARHSWATIARNDCGISKDDVGESLNHSNPKHTVTDIYLKKSWKINDKANRLVLNYLLLKASRGGTDHAKVVRMG